MTKTEDLVSIIVPCYNAANYLAEAIESILIQTYTNWECIIIDDDSVDGSVEVAKIYCKKNKDKIKCVSNLGKGACDARNYGIELSKGVYLKFLDADDALYDKNVLERQVLFLTESGHDITYGDELYFTDELIEERLIKKRGAPIDGQLQSFYKNFPITSNFLIKKASLQTIKWNARLKSGQEFFLLFQCYLSSLKFGYHAINTCRIRAHNSTHRISNKPRSEYAIQVYELFQEMHEEIKRHKVSNDYLHEFKKQLLIHSYHSIRFRNYKALTLMQQLLSHLKYVKLTGFKLRLVFCFNSISPFLGYGLYKFLTLNGRSFQ